MQDNVKCYMCDSIATSKEHTPPKCLFPTGKDNNGNGCRNNLITVPSCDEHNAMKSKDDEFLLMSLAYALGNNEKGLNLGFSKVKRNLDRKPYLLNSVLKDQVNVILKDDLKKYDMLVGRPDLARLNESFKKIFHGLYRHHFEKNFDGNIIPFMMFLEYADDNCSAIKKIVTHKFSKELEGKKN